MNDTIAPKLFADLEAIANMSDKPCRASENQTPDPAGAMKRFVAWLRDNEAGIRPYFNYSGRGMFGATCFGMAGSFEDIQTAFMDFAEDNPDCRSVVRQRVRGQCHDQMGLNMIVYFPDVDIGE